MQFMMLINELSKLYRANLHKNDREELQTLQYLLEEAVNTVRDAIAVTPNVQYVTIEVTVLGYAIPVEIKHDGTKSDDELYAMAKTQLRNLL